MFQDEDAAIAELQEKSKCYPYLSHALQTLPSDLGIMLEVKTNLAEEVSALYSCLRTLGKRINSGL